MKRILKDRKGISPVIATVIIVAVTIAVAIAVAFWMGGLTSIFTRFEKLEITSAYADFDTDGNFIITLNFKNTGSAAASISDILINGKPANSYVGICTSAKVTISGITIEGFEKAPLPAPVSVPIGSEGKVEVTGVKNQSPFISGVTVEVTIHTAAGKDYPKVVVLP
jgi:flagellin-like protein